MKNKMSNLCCERFAEWFQSGDICYAYDDNKDIDETEWYISGMGHLYYCPFCGAFIKGYGFGEYNKKYPPTKETRVFKQNKKA